MPVLPPISDFVTTGQTKGTFKGALTGLRAYLSGLLGDAGTQAAALTALGAPLNAAESKSGAYTVVAADRGKLIDCTGAGGWTLGITAAASLGAGFVFAVRNSSSGIITVDPNLSEQINGMPNLPLWPGVSGLFLCDGAAIKTVGYALAPEQVYPAQAGNSGRFLSTNGTETSWKNQMWEEVPAGSGSITAVAYIDIDLHEDVYCEWKLVLDGAGPASDGQTLYLRPLYSGMTLQGAAGACYTRAFDGAGADITGGSYPMLVGDALAGVSNAAGAHCHCVATISCIGSSGASGLVVRSTGGFLNKSTKPNACVADNTYRWDGNTARLCDGIRLIWSSGTFAAKGTYKLYGMRRV